MYCVFESESIMDFNLFSHIFDKYEFLYNGLYGFAKKHFKDRASFIWTVFLLLLLLFTHKYKYDGDTCIREYVFLNFIF